MVIFMTSSPGGHTWDEVQQPEPLDESNDFVSNVKKYWKKDSKCITLASYPERYEVNDMERDIMRKAFEMSGLSVSTWDVCDRRNCDKVIDKLQEYDYILLSGGHVPTENAFYSEIGLKEALKGFDGILMGISAGTMNCAKDVYSIPELEGESIDPAYKRYLKGLGFTDINIIPHYQYLKNIVLDGRLMIKDITGEDSYGREFLVIPDGSYVLIENNMETVYGEAYIFTEGVMTQICERGKCKILRKE